MENRPKMFILQTISSLRLDGVHNTKAAFTVKSVCGVLHSVPDSCSLEGTLGSTIAYMHITSKERL